MRLTVCGNAREYLAPFSAGTAYVVATERTRVVVDAGQGTLAAIGRALDGAEVDAVILSHLHFDHATDLAGLLKACPPGVPLFAPPGSRASLDALASAYRFRGPFDLPGPLVDATSEGEFAVGDTTIRFAEATHRAPAIAVSLESTGRKLVLAGDGGPSPAVEALAAGADLLVCHALLPDVDPQSEHARVHTTGATAGRLASAAKAGRLLLSHVHHRTDPEALLRAARFGRAEVATSGRTYTVGRRA